MTVISARSNARVRRWRALGQDARLRRSEQRALIEGEHLLAAYLDSGRKVEALIVSASGQEKFAALARRAGAPVVLADAVFESIADADSPAGVAAEIAVPDGGQVLNLAGACVFLDGIQDAGNVGALLRSAAAFGIGDAVLGPGCADAWSPKVLRAAMGAHFAMRLTEAADLDGAIAAFGGKLCCTVPRGGIALSQADLSGRVGWLFGAEGRGVGAALAARADLKITIPMAGSAESLNVAAAAAICFYEFSRRGARS